MSDVNEKNKCACAECGKEFYRRGNRKFRCKFITCSKICKNKHQSKFSFKHRPKLGQPRNCNYCGKEYYRPPSQIGKYCTQECRYSDPNFSPKKENHYRWKGGVKQNRKIDLPLRKWRRLLIKYNSRKCATCGIEERVMFADHILPYSDFPEYRYTLSNGQILCKIHHWQKTSIENKNREKNGNLKKSYKIKLMEMAGLL